VAVNFQHLRTFHAVALESSFSRAARRLNISQPTLSQQLKLLESRYGTMLFEGRSRPLNLTPIGQELLVLTRRIFAAADEIEDLLGNRPITQPIRIRLASDSPIYAARLTETLMRADPRAVVEVQVDNSHDTLDRLLEAKADVAIVSDPPIDPRFAYKLLFVDTLKMVVPAAHPLARVRKFPLAAIAGECLLLREASSKTRAATESLLRAHEISPARTIELHSREAIREAVAIGLGISLFYSSECPPDQRLRVVNPDCQPDSTLLTGYVVCTVDRRRSATMRAVYEAADQLATLSPVSIETGSLHLTA